MRETLQRRRESRGYDPRTVEIVQLETGEDVASRPFAAPERTAHDATVMNRMLAELRSRAGGWSQEADGEGDFHLNVLDDEGHRHWIRIPDRAALLAADRFTAVGFFGKARDDVDQLTIHELEAGIVDTLETIAGVLCYYDVALAEGGYGNLILCATAAAPAEVHGHELHRRAVELTPRHYHSVRLHNGAVPGPLESDTSVAVERTRYYDYDSDPPWLAVRVFAPPW